MTPGPTISPAIQKKRELLAQGEAVREQIRVIDQRIAGLGMTPKRFRAHRAEELLSERKVLVERLQKLKDEFHAVQS